MIRKLLRWMDKRRPLPYRPLTDHEAALVISGLAGRIARATGRRGEW